MSDTISNKLLLSRKESSALTGLSLRTIANLIASRELRSIRVGRRRLVPRTELARFIQRDHSTSSVPPKEGGPMKIKKRKLTKKRKTRKKILRKKTARRRHKAKRRIVRHHRARRISTIALNPHEADTQRKVARVLRRMLEGGESLSKATRHEGIKSKTFVRFA
jgi:excisionase family DNA binding protein